MTKDELVTLVMDYDDLILLADGFEDAFIGLAERCSQPLVAVYDMAKCIEILVKQGMTETEAEEYFTFNVVGAWVGERTPLFLFRPPTMETE